MDMDLVLISSALLAIAMLLRLQRNRAAVVAHKGVLQQRLIEVAQNSELTKRACFASLENLNRRLEQLQSRANAAEEKLNTLAEPAKVDRTENYQAAGLLLAGGHSVARVAAILGLPAKDVELVGQLQKMAVKEPAAIAPRQNEATEKSLRRRRKKASMAEKILVREPPILLTEAIGSEGANGSHRNGHHMASNGAAA
jgi:hypothetical protein